VLAADERSFRRLLPASDSQRLSCPSTGAPDPSVIASRPKLKAFFDRYAAACKDVQEARQASSAAPANGLLGADTAQWERERRAVETQKAVAATRGNAYADARRMYDEAVQKREELRRTLKQDAATLKEADDKVAAAMDSARKALAGLGSTAIARGTVTNAFALADELRERYTGVVDAIGRIAGGKPKEESGFEIVASAALKLEELDAETGLARLLLEASRLRGQFTAAQVLAEHAERRVALLGAHRRALLDELSELLDGADALAESVSRCKAAESTTVIATFRGAPDPLCRQAIAQTLIHFGNAYTIGELHARIAEKRTTGDLHDQAIEISAAALRTWEDALAVPINSVAERHAAGIKPEDAARLAVEGIGAAALLGIAVK